MIHILLLFNADAAIPSTTPRNGVHLHPRTSNQYVDVSLRTHDEFYHAQDDQQKASRGIDNPFYEGRYIYISCMQTGLTQT